MPYQPTILKTAQVVLGTASQDVSDHVTEVRINQTWQEIDDTRMGVSARSRLPGLESWDMTVTLIQDFQSTGAAIEKLLAALAANSALSSPVTFPISVRPFQAARSSDNPEWSGNVYMFGYTPIAGAAGELLKTTVPFLSAGNLTRTVSSSS
jgi:hypothetical protein